MKLSLGLFSLSLEQHTAHIYMEMCRGWNWICFICIHKSEATCIVKMRTLYFIITQRVRGRKAAKSHQNNTTTTAAPAAVHNSEKRRKKRGKNLSCFSETHICASRVRTRFAFSHQQDNIWDGIWKENNASSKKGDDERREVKKLDEKRSAERERCDVSEHNYSAHISYTTFCWSKKFSKRRENSSSWHI